jgi:hypothetical protein
MFLYDLNGKAEKQINFCNSEYTANVTEFNDYYIEMEVPILYTVSVFISKTNP